MSSEKFIAISITPIKDLPKAKPEENSKKEKKENNEIKTDSVNELTNQLVENLLDAVNIDFLKREDKPDQKTEKNSIFGFQIG